MSELAREPRYIGTLYDRSLGRLIPRTHFFAMLFLPIFDTIFYFLSTFVAEHSEKGSFALPIDGMIPLVEEFILIYFGCYLFWFGGLLFMACHKTDVFWDFFARVFVSLIVAFSFFMLMTFALSAISTYRRPCRRRPWLRWLLPRQQDPSCQPQRSRW